MNAGPGYRSIVAKRRLPACSHPHRHTLISATRAALTVRPPANRRTVGRSSAATISTRSRFRHELREGAPQGRQFPPAKKAPLLLKTLTRLLRRPTHAFLPSVTAISSQFDPV